MDLKQSFLFCACEVYAIVRPTKANRKKNRGKYTGFPHTASLKNAAHTSTLHINQMSVLTCH